MDRQYEPEMEETALRTSGIAEKSKVSESRATIDIERTTNMQQAHISPGPPGTGHMVKRAVILAAGFGSRMQPLTLETPKPLVNVCGTRMIDSSIRGLIRNGIREIYVVTGYLAKKFRGLQDQYPGLQLIENPWYAEANNISSIYAARDHLEDCMIIEGDHLYRNPDIFFRNFDESGYNAFWCAGATDEWLCWLDSDGHIDKISDHGGRNGWLFYGVSRWTAEDGRRLSYYIAKEFEAGNRNIYWDRIPCTLYPQDFQMRLFQTGPGDQVEIDSLKELAQIDPRYKKLLGGGEKRKTDSFTQTPSEIRTTRKTE